VDRLEAVKCASSLLLDAGLHVEGCDQAFPVVDGAVLLANFTAGLHLVADFDLERLEALEGAGCLFPYALRWVSSQDDALAHVNSAVLLALPLLTSLNMRNDGLVPLGNELDSLEAIECAGSFLLEAGLHVESLDEALASVDGAVLLAHLSGALDSRSVVPVAGTMLVTLNGETLEAIEGAGGFLLQAELHISLEDQAFSIVDAAVLLADAHISHDKRCSETYQGEKNLSHYCI
jgi:hypothetical protein